MTRATSLTFVTAVVATLLTATSVHAASPITGIYAGKAPGVTAQVKVATDGKATLNYSIKTECGKARGKMDLKPAGAGLKGKRLSRGPQSSLRTTSAKFTVSADGMSLTGTLRDALGGGDSKLSGCKGKKNVSAKLAHSEQFVPARDTGHYVGTSANGRAISFDAVEDPGSDGYLLANFDIQVDADCYDEDAEVVSVMAMVVHLFGLTGFEAPLASDGKVELDYEPDATTVHSVYGRVADGQARLEIEVAGTFDRQGEPMAGGPLDCDNFGAVYTAARH